MCKTLEKQAGSFTKVTIPFHGKRLQKLCGDGQLFGLSSERPMVMHTVKQEKCQILWTGLFHGTYPPVLTSDRNFGKSTFHTLYNDACKFAINLFPTTSGPFENVNLLYYLLKIQISNGCNVLNIAGNPIKDINVNLSFLSSGSKVVECLPQKLTWKFFNFISEYRIKSCGI